MNDHQAPERIWVWPSHYTVSGSSVEEMRWTPHFVEDSCNQAWPSPRRDAFEYVPASALEAAQARIVELEARPPARDWVEAINEAISNTRLNTYRQCAAIADDWWHHGGKDYSPGDDIRATLEALEGGKNHGNG